MVSFHLILKVDAFLNQVTQNRYVEEGRLIYNELIWHLIHS